MTFRLAQCFIKLLSLQFAEVIVRTGKALVSTHQQHSHVLVSNCSSQFSVKFATLLKEFACVPTTTVEGLKSCQLVKL